MKKDVSMQSNLEINKKEGVVTVSINPKIYPLDVVFSAGYVFTEKSYVLIDGDPEEEIIVELRPKVEYDITKLGREFNNELINYATYAVQALKNQQIRESIISRVMMTNTATKEANAWNDTEPRATTETIHEQAQSNDDIATPWEEDSWMDDPEGIAVPWEEKYGKDRVDDARQEVALSFNPDLYCMDCVEKAIEDFSECADIFKGEDKILLRPKDENTPEVLGREFYNYVLGLMKN